MCTVGRSEFMLTHNSLCAILESHESPDWSNRTVEGGGDNQRWLPVISFAPHSYGLLISGNWVAEYADRERVMPVDYYVGFLPLLERPHPEIISLLKSSVARSRLPDVVATTFPLDDVLECAILSSGHWRQCAESWIENGYPLNHTLVKLLPENPLVRQWQRERVNRIFGDLA